MSKKTKIIIALIYFIIYVVYRSLIPHNNEKFEIYTLYTFYVSIFAILIFHLYSLYKEDKINRTTNFRKTFLNIFVVILILTTFFFIQNQF
jgi:hypothetical protein